MTSTLTNISKIAIRLKRVSLSVFDFDYFSSFCQPLSHGVPGVVGVVGLVLHPFGRILFLYLVRCASSKGT